MRVGMIGLGNIGRHIATNLVADGHEVTVYDVDAERVKAIEGAEAAPSVAAVGAASEITMMSLPSPEVVRQVADEWASTAPSGSILVDLSTNSPTVVRELGTRLARTGHQLVEAPLTGGEPGAEHRMLMFMIGGDDDAVARALPVIEPLGRAAFHLGPLGRGNTMKLVNSLLAYAATWASLEGLSLCAKAGITVQKTVEVLRTGGTTNFFLDRMVEGIDDREPADELRAGAGREGHGPRRRHRSQRSACPLRPARRCSRCSWARSRRGSATTTGATSCPPPSDKAASSSAGTPTDLLVLAGRSVVDR